MDPVLTVALELIILHTLDKREVYVNANHVVSLAEQKGKDQFASGVSCVVNLLDHKFVTVVETCSSIRKRLGDILK